MQSLIARINNSDFLRTAATLTLATWLFLEAGSFLFETFGASEQAVRYYVIVVVICFVIALLLSLLTSKSNNAPQKAKSETGTFSLRSNKVIIGMLAAALVVSVGLNIFGLRSNQSNPVEETEIGEASIAVLPLENLSSDPLNSGFADGIHDDLITKLANIGSLRVISRTSVMGYRGTLKKMAQIGRELGVRYLLEGSVQRIGNSIRINAQLIDANTDEHLWAQTYDREVSAKSIFAIQSDITTAISKALKATLSPSEASRVSEVPTENIAAYRLFSSARQNLDLRLEQSLRAARDQFREAIVLDPNYAEAHVGLAQATILLMINERAIPFVEASSAAQVSLDTALTLNPDLASAHATQGLVYTQQAMRMPDGKYWQYADSSFKRALELNPNNAEAWMWYASIKENEGDYAQAIELNRKAQELNPAGRIPYLSIPKLLSATGQTEAASQEYELGLEIHPTWPVLFFSYSDHLEKLGRLDYSLQVSDRGLKVSTEGDVHPSRIGVLHQLGFDEEVAKAIEAVPVQHPSRYILEAYSASLQGDHATALSFIDTAYERTGDKQVRALSSDFSLLAGKCERLEALVRDILPDLLEIKVDQQLNLNPYHADLALNWGLCLKRNGRENEASSIAEAALELVKGQPRLGVSGHGILDVQALSLLDKQEEALAAFSEAVAAGFVSTLAFAGWSIEQDPFLQTINKTPEFQAQLALLKQNKRQQRENYLLAAGQGLN